MRVRVRVRIRVRVRVRVRVRLRVRVRVRVRVINSAFCSGVIRLGLSSFFAEFRKAVEPKKMGLSLAFSASYCACVCVVGWWLSV